LLGKRSTTGERPRAAIAAVAPISFYLEKIQVIMTNNARPSDSIKISQFLWPRLFSEVRGNRGGKIVRIVINRLYAASIKENFNEEKFPFSIRQFQSARAGDRRVIFAPRFAGY
jgi:hypothetical protein